MIGRILEEAMLKKTSPEFLYLNGDEGDVPDLLSHATSARLKLLTGLKKYIFLIVGFEMRLSIISNRSGTGRIQAPCGRTFLLQKD